VKRQPNRLPAEGEHRLKGAAIDRTKPLRFWLDGRPIHGFVGDTVLSAALASGLVSAGTRAGQPLALDERYAPPVAVKDRGARGEPPDPLPMARTPALDGLKLRSLGHRPALGRFAAGLGRLLPMPRHRLGLRHDRDTPLAPWLNTPPGETTAADVAVVGGGLAGMAAALAAAETGASVILLECRPWLGGAARLFGATGEEETPEATIRRLAEAIAAAAGIRTLLATEAFGVFPGLVQAHRVVVEGNVPTGRLLAIEAPRIVLANGALERLPVFAGNRRPGVVGVLAAYERAERYGVWIGRRALFATATNVAYRVAAQIKSEAVAVLRIADSRVNPQSRFVEFAKAYGIPQAQDTIPLSVQPGSRAPQELKITLARATQGAGTPPESLVVDQLVVAGGWQADLTLWHMAGGASRWDESEHRFAAEGSLPGIALAGSVAGYETAAACLASGAAALAVLSGKATVPIEDRRIEALYETSDAPTPIGPPAGSELEPAYLDGGGSLTARPEQQAAKRRRRPARLTDEVRSLSLSDVAAAVQLGLVPAEQAASIAQERWVTPGDLVDAGKHAPPLPAETSAAGVPLYLSGRFGDEDVVRGIEAADGRRLDVGCLIYPNADRADPVAAIGVVFAAAPSGRGGLALIGRAAATLDGVSVRDISGPVSARLKEPTHELSTSVPSDGEPGRAPAIGPSRPG
jgi:sarcosine oxidase subunit alpha